MVRLHPMWKYKIFREITEEKKEKRKSKWDEIMGCPLCRAEHITEWKYEDETCWVARCATHRNKWIIVLKRHAPLPTPEEAEHMQQVANKLFPEKGWRYPRSILDHFHLHEDG